MSNPKPVEEKLSTIEEAVDALEKDIPNAEKTRTAVLLSKRHAKAIVDHYRARYSEQIVIDEIAKRFWIADYPNGGSLYKSYEETPYHDQEAYRKEARDILIGETM